LTGRRQAFDDKTKRRALRFGDFEAPLADADIAQLHDTLMRLHGYPDAIVERLCASLRQLLEGSDEESVLELDAAAARKVQLAVYSDQIGRKRISPALEKARLQAFRYLDQEGVIAALQQARSGSQLHRRRPD
jgi:hypothetical protein